MGMGDDCHFGPLLPVMRCRPVPEGGRDEPRRFGSQRDFYLIVEEIEGSSGSSSVLACRER